MAGQWPQEAEEGDLTAINNRSLPASHTAPDCHWAPLAMGPRGVSHWLGIPEEECRFKCQFGGDMITLEKKIWAKLGSISYKSWIGIWPDTENSYACALELFFLCWGRGCGVGENSIKEGCKSWVRESILEKTLLLPWDWEMDQSLS